MYTYITSFWVWWISSPLDPHPYLQKANLENLKKLICIHPLEGGCGADLAEIL